MKQKINVAVLSALILAGSTNISARTFQIGGGGVVGDDVLFPIALGDSAVVVPNDVPSATGNVTDNDSNGISAILTSSPASEYGYLILNNDGNYTYTLYENSPLVSQLAAGEVIVEHFSYLYSNEAGQSVSSTLTVQIVGNPVDGAGNTVFGQLSDNVDVEFNDRSRDATPLNSGLNIKGHLHNSSDKDWYSLSSAGNEVITLEVCPQGSACHGKKSWVLYVFDSDKLSTFMEERTYTFRSSEGPAGWSNHMYLAYNLGYFDGALIGVIDPCFDTSNSVDIGVGEGARNYFIAISSPLKGDAADADTCGAGSVILEREITNADGSEGEQEYIVVFPNSDDQYSINVTGTGVNPLLAPIAQAKSSTFDVNDGLLKIPKLRVFDSFYEANLNIQQSITDNNNMQFTLSNLNVLSTDELADGFQATYNPATQRVLIPRVSVSTGEAYSVVLQYHFAIANHEAWLEVIDVTLIQ